MHIFQKKTALFPIWMVYKRRGLCYNKKLERQTDRADRGARPPLGFKGNTQEEREEDADDEEDVWELD